MDAAGVLSRNVQSCPLLQALSSRNIFVKKLRAAESLAYVDTIITDKTGTLTHNRLRLTGAWAPGNNDVSGTSAAESDGNGKC